MAAKKLSGLWAGPLFRHRQPNDVGWQAGVTLLEIIVVLAILGVVMGYSAVYLTTSDPQRILAEDLAEITQLLDQARYGALQTGNQWGLQIEERNRGPRIQLINDDGWLGTVTPLPPSLGKTVRPREFYEGSPDFDPALRQNHQADVLDDLDRSLELVRSITLSPEVFLVEMKDSELEVPFYMSFDRNGRLSDTILDEGDAVSKPNVVILWLSTLEPSVFSTLDHKQRREFGRAIAILPSGNFRVIP